MDTRRTTLGLFALGLGAAALAVLWGIGVFDSETGTMPSGSDSEDGRSPVEGAAGMSPTLEGQHVGDDMAPAPEDPLDALIRRTREGADEEQVSALRELKALHAAGKLPMRRLIELVIAHPSDAGSLELHGFALWAIRGAKVEAQEHLDFVLTEALGASRVRQDRIAALLREIGQVRAEDVPAVQKLFEHKASRYWLKRVLVETLDGLGPKAAPLTGSLVAFIRTVLVERAKDAKEAAEAGLHVSWDHVEIDVEHLLSGMGEAGVPRMRELIRVGLASPVDPATGERAYFPTGILVSSLAAAGPAGVDALLALVGEVSGADLGMVQRALLDVPGPHPGVRTYLAELARSEDAGQRLLAARGLAKHGAPTERDLRVLLRDVDPRVRLAAVNGLQTLGRLSRSAVAPLLEILDPKHPRTLAGSAEALAGIGEPAAVALPTLLGLLDRVHPGIAKKLVEPIARLSRHDVGPLGAALDQAGVARIPLLLRIAGRVDPWSRQIETRIDALLTHTALEIRVQAAALALPRGRPGAMRPLLEGFHSRFGRSRAEATQALADAGPQASKLLPEMMRRIATTDREGSVLYPGGEGPNETRALSMAIRKLGRFDFDAVLPGLGRPPFEVKFAAGRAFDSAGEAGAKYLLEAWPQLSKEARISALSLSFRPSPTEQVSPPSFASRSALRRTALADEDEDVLIAAFDVCHNDASVVDAFRAALLRALASKDPITTGDAARHIRQMGGAAAPMRAALEAYRAHPHPGTRRAILRVLEGMPDAGK